MCRKWHQMSALAERSGRGEVKPRLFRAVMKTDARALTQGARGKPQLLEPPGADPHAGWCGRGERATAPPIPIARFVPGARRPDARTFPLQQKQQAPGCGFPGITPPCCASATTNILQNLLSNPILITQKTGR
jgi:hypothetical protein